jgi:hypothetical protein
MAIDIRDYVAAGYFLSRYVGVHDCTGIELRRVSLAQDHSQRKFFPDSWALSWCHGTRQERIDQAAVFGITERGLDRVIDWADRSFDTAFGAWSVFYGIGDARGVTASFLKEAVDLELWGLGLHRSLLSAYCEASKPPPQKPGYAPSGASGFHVAACVRPTALADGGDVLGHELLIEEVGCCLNSPESRHLDELGAFRAVGVEPNNHGLIDSFDDALACCKHLDEHAAETQHHITGWIPWLIVRYSTDTTSRT